MQTEQNETFDLRSANGLGKGAVNSLGINGDIIAPKISNPGTRVAIGDQF